MQHISAQTSTAHKKIGTDKESWEGTFKISGAEDEEAILEFFSKFEKTIIKSTGQKTLDPEEEE